MRKELTEVEIKQIKEEIKHRQEVTTPTCIAEVQRTRALGDLSENDEYRSAKRSRRLIRTALLELLAEEKGAEGLNELLTSWWAIPAVDRVLWRAGDRAMDLLDRLLSSAREAHLALTGRVMDERGLTMIRHRLRPLVQSTSVRGLMEVFSALGVVPHRLTGPYAAIVMNQLDDLQPFIWIKVSAGLPVRRYGSWTDAGEWPQMDTPVFAHRRRAAAPAYRSKLRVSYSAKRNG